MAVKSSDVEIRVGAKADESGAKTAASKVERTLNAAISRTKRLGTEVAKHISSQLSAIKADVLSGKIAHQDASALASELLKASKAAGGAEKQVTGFAAAIWKSVDASEEIAKSLDKINAVKIDLKTKDLEKRLDITQKAKAFGDSIRSMLDAASEGLPDSEKLMSVLEEMQAVLAGGKLDGAAFKKLEGQIRRAAQEMKGLDNNLTGKLAPHILNVSRAFNDLRSSRGFDGTIAGSIDEITTAIGRADSAAARVVGTLAGWVDKIKVAHNAIGRFPVAFSVIAASVATVVAAFNKMLDAKKAAFDSNAEAGRAVREVRANAIDAARERSDRNAAHKESLEDTKIANARAVEDAKREQENNRREAEKAQEMARARSDGERENIERRYAAMAADVERDAGIIGIKREREDNARAIQRDKDRLNRNDEQSKAIEKLLRQTQTEQALILEEGRARRKTNDAAGESVWGAIGAGLQNLGGDIWQKAKEMFDDDTNIERSADEQAALLGEVIEKLRAKKIALAKEKQDTEAALTEHSEVVSKFADMERAVEARREAVLAGLDAEKTAQGRGHERENVSRQIQLSDRDWDEEQAVREQKWRRLEMSGGIGASERAARERKAVADAKLAMDEYMLKREEEFELTRLNSIRESQGRDAISSTSHASEHELSEEFKTMRAHLEGKITSDRAAVRSADDALLAASMSRRAQETEFYAGANRQSNRLTAMGLGGDVSGKATAESTKSTAESLKKIIPMVQTLANRRAGGYDGKPAAWGVG